MGSCISLCRDTELQKATLQTAQEFGVCGYKAEAKVVDVYDGDTLTLAFRFCGKIFKKRCRIEGVDCAELRSKDEEERRVGNVAKDYVSNLVLNKVVWVEFSESSDKYGRLLAQIFPKKGGASLAAILISAGLGYEYHGEHKRAFRDWYAC